MNKFYVEKYDTRHKIYFGDHAIHIGDMYPEDDGFYVFDPNSNLSGVYNEHLLKFLTNYMVELNKPWHDFIKENLK
jgi:hypothetical protein